MSQAPEQDEDRRLEWHTDWMRVDTSAGGAGFLHPSGRYLQVRDGHDLELLSWMMHRHLPVGAAASELDHDRAQSVLRLAGRLTAEGVLIRSLPAEVPWLTARRYARLRPQITALTTTLRSTDRALAAQKRIVSGKVVILGAGGSGSMVALELISAGVQSIRIVDHDVVEASNLGRQLLYKERDIGVPKVAALASFLREYDSDADVEPVQEQVTDAASAYRILKGYDIVVVTADEPWPELLRWVGRASRQAGVAVLPTFYSAYGPLLRPGRAPCMECVLQWMEESMSRAAGRLTEPLSNERGARRLGGIGFGITAAAAEYSREVVAYLSGTLTARSTQGSVARRQGQTKVTTDVMTARCAQCREFARVTPSRRDAVQR